MLIVAINNPVSALMTDWKYGERCFVCIVRIGDVGRKDVDEDNEVFVN